MNNLPMDANQFIYVPDLSAEDEFRCRVLLPDNLQQYIINGNVRGGKTPFELNLGRGERMEKSLQIIGVRGTLLRGDLPLRTRFLGPHNLLLAHPHPGRVLDP